MNLFEKATRLKLRFPTSAGAASVEDLWDLPLTSTNKPNLDDIAKRLNRDLKESAEEESFVKPAATGKNEITHLAFDIVKYVIDVKVQERDVAAAAAEKRQKKQQLLELLARKENEALEQKSPEEIRAMLEAL